MPVGRLEGIRRQAAIRARRLRPGVLGGLAAVVLGVVLAGCASMSNVLGTSVLESEAAKAPFIEAATARIAGKDKTDVNGQVAVAAPLRSATSPARAYSGSPDGLSLKVIFERGGIIDVPRMHAYMLRVLDRILQNWPYEVERIGLFVVSQPGFDAQATAAGDILLTSGMLAQLESEDELAAILAHEVSHILLNHHVRAQEVADNKRMLNTAASATITYLMFSNTDWVKTGKGSYHGTVNTGSWLTQSLQAGGACLAATYMVDKLIDPGWSRTQEDEADLLGIDLMIKAGYNPNAALQAMRRRVAYEGETRQTLVEARSQKGEYEEMMNSAVAQQGVFGVVTGAARTVAAGVIDTFSDVDDYIAQKHRMSSDRLNSMQVYLDRHYPLRERKPLEIDAYAKVVKSKEVVATFENHRFAREAADAVMKNDLPAALPLAERSIRSPTSHAVSPRFSMYMVLSAMDKGDEAFKHLLAVKDLDNAPPQFFEAMSAGYARRGNMQLAEQMKQRARAKAKSIYDEKDKSSGATFLHRLLSPQPEAAHDRYEVTGYCEALRAGVASGAGAISGRQL